MQGSAFCATQFGEECWCTADADVNFIRWDDGNRVMGFFGTTEDAVYSALDAPIQNLLSPRQSR